MGLPAGLDRYKEPPQLICPECKLNIEDRRWRARCFASPFGLHCPCGKKVTLQLGGNYWYGMIIGAALLLIGGRLWAAGLPFPLCMLFFPAGGASMLWGIYNSGLSIKEKQPPGKSS